MKIVSLLFICLVSTVSVSFAGSYTCSVWGEYDGVPSGSNTKGTYAEEFKATGATQAEASQSAQKQCAQTIDRCDETPSCRELVLLDPRPLAPDSEVSCADDTGLQVVITLYPSTYERLATVYKSDVQVASFIVKPFTPSNQSKPIDYESPTGDFDLSLPNHLSMSKGYVIADGPVRCIWPQPQPSQGNGFPALHGH